VTEYRWNLTWCLLAAPGDTPWNGRLDPSIESAYSGNGISKNRVSIGAIVINDWWWRRFRRNFVLTLRAHRALATLARWTVILRSSTVSEGSYTVVLQVSISVYTIICSRYYPLCVLFFTSYLLLCCTVCIRPSFVLFSYSAFGCKSVLLLPPTHSGGGSIVLFFGVCRLSSSVTLQCAT